MSRKVLTLFRMSSSMKSRSILVSVAVLLGLLLSGAMLLHAPQAQARVAEPERGHPAAIAALPVIDDFEAGMPGGWFQYGDYGSGTAIATKSAVATDTVPGAAAGNHALQIAYVSAGWGAGTGRDIPGEDWSSYDGLRFWFKGEGSGVLYRLILSDNGDPNVGGDTSERFAYEWNDTAAGWRPWRFPGPLLPRSGLPARRRAQRRPDLDRGQGLRLCAAQRQQQDDLCRRHAPLQLHRAWMTSRAGSGRGAVQLWRQRHFGGQERRGTDTVPGGAAGNNALKVDYVSVGWGAGFGHDIPGEDWSKTDGLSFWFRGNGSGALSGDPERQRRPQRGRRHLRALRLRVERHGTGWRYDQHPLEPLLP